jgi:hypothetical protein
MHEERGHNPCALSERLAVTADRPRAAEDEEALSAYGMGLRGSTSHPLFAVPLSSGRQGPVAESRERSRHGCQRPSCGHGSGPTGNCMPEMPDCDQPRRALPACPVLCKAWVILDAAFRWRGCAHFRFRSTHMQSNGCAHTETRSALTQIVSQKKAKAELSIARQRSRD